MKTQSQTPNIQPRALRMLLATMLVAVAGAVSQTALANPGGGHGGPGGAEMHGGRGMPGGMGLMGNPRMVERMLDTVNATAEQRAQVKQILQTAQAEMQTQRESGHKLHQQGQALFAQPTVDARAAEVLRLQMVAQHDQASKRMMQTMLDVSARPWPTAWRSAARWWSGTAASVSRSNPSRARERSAQRWLCCFPWRPALAVGSWPWRPWRRGVLAFWRSPD